MKNKNKSNTVSVRYANKGDISGMLKIEISRYGGLYKEKDAIEEVKMRFEKRVQVAKNWMWVAEINSQIVGFITGQPTDTETKDFKSWEESTDSGTLEKTFDKSGKNVYVVNLDVSREAAKLNAQYMLMAQLGAKSIRLGKVKIIFESRMPNFREFILEEKKLTLDKWNSFDEREKMRQAKEYSTMTIERDGKIILKDRLLRFYDSGGFSLESVFANAFQDPESLNFGMLCTAKNPIPKVLRVAPVNYVVSKIFTKIGKNPGLLSKLIG